MTKAKIREEGVMQVAGRFYYERIKEFDRAVRAGEYPNAKSMAKRL